MKEIPQRVRRDLEEASVWAVEGEFKERILSEDGDLTYAETYKSFYLFINTQYINEHFAYSKELDRSFTSQDGFELLYSMIDDVI